MPVVIFGRAPQTPPDVAPQSQEEAMESISERVHDLESGMRLLFVSIGELRQANSDLRQANAEIHNWLWSCMRTFHNWLSSCMRTFPWH